jgi:hypothetical protein
MRTLTAYGIGVVIVLAVLNGIAWQAGMARLHSLYVFSAGFVLGMLGTSLAALLYGYRRVARWRAGPGPETLEWLRFPDAAQHAVVRR